MDTNARQVIIAREGPQLQSCAHKAPTGKIKKARNFRIVFLALTTLTVIKKARQPASNVVEVLMATHRVDLKIASVSDSTDSGVLPTTNAFA